MKKGFFITFEGPEGSGKSTHCALLVKYLKSKGCDIVFTREPGGTKAAEAVRSILLNPANTISPIAELLLYEASRAQHISEIILPALKSGKIVICDRFTDATIAYQGYGRNIDINIIRQLNNIAAQEITPNLTILLDVPSAKGLKLARNINKGHGTSGDRLEREKLSFHRRVRKGYLLLAKNEPERIKLVRTRKTVESTRREIIRIVTPLFAKEGYGGVQKLKSNSPQSPLYPKRGRYKYHVI